MVVITTEEKESLSNLESAAKEVTQIVDRYKTTLSGM